MPRERFEEALNKLEKIVSKLEDGDIPLEESLRLFEEGVRLSRFCNQKLDEAEKRVEILLRGKEGVLEPQAFDPAGNSGQPRRLSKSRLFRETRKGPFGGPGRGPIGRRGIGFGGYRQVFARKEGDRRFST